MSEDPLALSTNSAAPLADADYDTIYAAVTETQRGRWFLAEYARRNRNADTAVLLRAIERIEAAIGGEPDASPSGDANLGDMAQGIARAKAEIAAIGPDAEAGRHPADAGDDIGAMVQATDIALAAALAGAGERMRDIVWTLREREGEPMLCAALDASAREIDAACELHDTASRRSQIAMRLIMELEHRVNVLLGLGGDNHVVAPVAPPAAAPPAAGKERAVQMFPPDAEAAYEAAAFAHEPPPAAVVTIIEPSQYAVEERIDVKQSADDVPAQPAPAASSEAPAGDLVAASEPPRDAEAVYGGTQAHAPFAEPHVPAVPAAFADSAAAAEPAVAAEPGPPMPEGPAPAQAEGETAVPAVSEPTTGIPTAEPASEPDSVAQAEAAAVVAIEFASASGASEPSPGEGESAQGDSADAAARVAPHPMPRPPQDPLAAVDALSEDEKIALFS
jgi:hypothetical protein